MLAGRGGAGGGVHVLVGVALGRAAGVRVATGREVAFLVVTLVRWTAVRTVRVGDGVGVATALDVGAAGEGVVSTLVVRTVAVLFGWLVAARATPMPTAPTAPTTAVPAVRTVTRVSIASRWRAVQGRGVTWAPGVGAVGV